MNFSEKKVGIWGFGITGQAALRFFIKHGAHVCVMDKKELSLENKQLLEKYNIPFMHEKEKELFFLMHDFILVSPGIDIRPYRPIIGHKLIAELDLFYYFWKKPIIAITGTVGKTTVTSLIAQLLEKAGKSIVVGGNIGTGCLDLLESPADIAVLEVADVQLRYCRSFAPDIALWTNFSTNHLDWHDNLDAYFSAKCNIFAHQSSEQLALAPVSLRPQLREKFPTKKFNWFDASKCAEVTDEVIYFVENDWIYKNSNKIACIQDLPDITYPINWIAIIAVLDIFGIDVSLVTKNQSYNLPAHRLELIATINNSLFYNDSKSTTAIATQTAVEKLSKNNLPIILFLGGKSKGVDRQPLIAFLAGKVAEIYCFGAESEHLSALCQKAKIKSFSYSTLDQAFLTCVESIKNPTQILFSPAGSSFDLFTDYQQRGNVFKQLVNNYIRAARPACPSKF